MSNTANVYDISSGRFTITYNLTVYNYIINASREDLKIYIMFTISAESLDSLNRKVTFSVLQVSGFFQFI